MWFDNQAKTAAEFYCSIFSNSGITASSSMAVQFEIEGLKVMGLNGGSMFKINPSISLYVTCTANEEIEKIWKRLTEGGTEVQCGWLRDSFGISRQIIPKALGSLMSDPEKTERIMQKVLKMKKPDLEAIINA